jgi:hypothetical protein
MPSNNNPTDSMSLDELAELCEAASGPDRELDALIDAATAKGRWAPHCEVAPSPTKGRVQYRTRGDSLALWHEQDARSFTASLDAAMTLVPDGWDWSVGTCGNGRGGHAFMRRPDGMGLDHEIENDAATPALALAAAALRARKDRTP